MSRAPASNAWWTEEADFCLTVLREWARYSGSFNDDRACFARYCDMQADSAAKDGAESAADIIRACANRARRQTLRVPS